MTIIDTHAHLYADEFRDDLPQVIARAKETGVVKALLPNIDEDSVAPLKNITEAYPDFFLPMMGLHPTSVSKNWKNQLTTIYEELNAGDYIAVGEVGVDLYWDHSLRDEQIAAFEEQLKWSADKNLPVAIHFRNATQEVIDSIKRVGENSLRGVFHSFGGTKGELDAILALKTFSIGINGVVTFKNSGLAETLVNCPKNKVILETDSPYLAPVPYRGKRNESSYLSFIVNKLSEIWGDSPGEIARLTTRNALELFSINSVL